MPVISTESELYRFREQLYNQFEHRADSAMELLDALCSSERPSSVVELSLNPLYRRDYTSLFKTIGAPQFPSLGQHEAALSEPGNDLLALVGSVVAVPEKYPYYLFGLDCTSIERAHAKTLADRGMVHRPTVVSGHKPVTIGHSYSLLASLPERGQRDAPWTIPLAMSRVATETTAIQVGLSQVKALMTPTHLAWSTSLCVLVADSAYGTKAFLEPLAPHQNLVEIARCRSNRVFYQLPVVSDTPPKRGRPRWYGERFDLKDDQSWHPPDELTQITETTHTGRTLQVTIQGWHNMLMRGSKAHPMHKHPFTLLRIERVTQTGQRVGAIMWLIVTGARRAELSAKHAHLAYRQRFDLEHSFRFQKRNLLLEAFQTPDVRHEQQWITLVMLAYVQLWAAHHLSLSCPRPWERSVKTPMAPRIRPSNVQRDWHRIIRQIGSPAAPPKPRGKSPGRQFGQAQTHRIRLPVVIKGKAQNTEGNQAA